MKKAKYQGEKSSVIYRSAIWTKAKILAEMGQYEEKFYGKAFKHRKHIV